MRGEVRGAGAGNELSCHLQLLSVSFPNVTPVTVVRVKTEPRVICHKIPLS